MENLEGCLYFIFIGGYHLNAFWSHDGRCLLNAICVCDSVCVRACARSQNVSAFSQMFCALTSSAACVCVYTVCVYNVYICSVKQCCLFPMAVVETRIQ